jgi:hypothetical protein
MTARIVLALAALAAATAFAGELRDDRACERARATVFGVAVGRVPAERQPAALAVVADRCRGTTATLAVAGALHAQGRGAQALPLARAATRAEPENPAAWRALASVAAGQAPAEARAAATRLRALDPRGRPPRSRMAGRSIP